MAWLGATLATALLLVLLLGAWLPALLWLERRQAAYMQDRTGAVRTRIAGASLGGLLQPLADALKLIAKERVAVRGGEAGLRTWAPVLAAVCSIAAFSVIPFAGSYRFGELQVALVLADVDWGVLLVLGLSLASGSAYLLSGWSSNSDLALLGAVRAGVQLVSCQLGLALSLIPMFAIYGSLRLTDMTLVQDATVGLDTIVRVVTAGGAPGGSEVAAPVPWLASLVLPAWGIVLNPLAFATFGLCALMAGRLPPFDLATSRSELAGGHAVELSGPSLGLFRLAEQLQIFAMACVVTTVFLGGHAVPWLDQQTIVGAIARWYGEGFASAVCLALHLAVFVLKVALVVSLQLVVRAALPRPRPDQLLTVCWTRVLPLAVLNVLVTALLLVGLGGVRT